MQSVEVSAKSLDEARKLAAEKLGAEIGTIQVTVLEETKGLFGKTTVRIRAEAIAAPSAPAPAAPAALAPEPVAAEAPAEKPKRGGRVSKKAPVAAAEPEPEAAPAIEPAAESDTEVMATEQDAEKLAELLRDLLSKADVNVTVKPTGISGRYVNLELDGKDAGYLVGKHGEVLNAMQYLVNIIGNRKLTAGVRATLDGNDYRKRREETLTQLALNIVEQVKKRGEEAVLDPLPAFERRVVHKALSTVTGITTYSEGEEPNRRVVIAPGE